MTAYVALVRAVNVSGTGKLRKEELKAMGEACGFGNVRTFIASGNLLFTSPAKEAAVKQRLEQRLATFFGKAVPAFVRSAAEMADVASANPFGDVAPNRVVACFIDETPAQAMIDEARNVQDERLALGPRVIYIAYGDGMADSKLKSAAIQKGTARNMNSVQKMADLLAGME
jgi:uncharacterized protein (DUF1697 family)